MSEQKFKEAKGALAHSQTLLDGIRNSQKMAQQGPPVEQPQPAPQPEPAPAPQPQPTSQEPSKEMGMIATFMNEVRGLFKGKEDEEKKTQELVEKHNKDVDEIKKGLSELLNEDDKEN